MRSKSTHVWEMLSGGAETYLPDSAGEIRVETLVLPWSAEEVTVTVEVIDGLAIFEGDMILGEVDAGGNIISRQSIAREDSDYRWPDATMIYNIAGDLSGTLQTRIANAIQHWEDNTDIRFVVRTNESAYVRFRSGDGCSSDVGYQGVRQDVFLASFCSTGNTIHEIGHALGLIHEQSRSDRDDFVEILEDNIEEDKEDNFEKREDDAFDLGDYDYCSIMHYGRTFFGIDDASGNPLDTINTLQPIPNETLANGNLCTDIGQRSSLSDGDLAAVRRLYPREALIWFQDQPEVSGESETGDFFGNAVAAGDFNDDGFFDLAVGAPWEDVGNIENAGAANVFYGTEFGLTASDDQLWHQDIAGVLGQAEATDEFGRALAVGDFNDDGFDDLAIGIWSEDVNGNESAGAVAVLHGSANGLSASDDQLWHQDSTDVAGMTEVGDLFGWSLAAGDFDGDGTDDLAIGALLEDIDAVQDSGMVHILFGVKGSGLEAADDLIFHVGNLGLAGLPLDPFIHLGHALVAGNFDNDARDDLAIGVPLTLGGAGAVAVLYGEANGLGGAQYWNQDVAGVPGVVEPGDQFGTALAAGDFDNDGTDDLAIGIPVEDVQANAGAGAVQVLPGTSSGLDAAGSQLWHQDSAGIKGVAEPFDGFGNALAAGDFDGATAVLTMSDS